MKSLKIIGVILIFFLLVWIDLPENLNLKFNTGWFKVNQKLQPLTINLTIFGKKFSKKFRNHYGLDLKGGSHLVFEADTSKLKKEDVNDAMISARDIIEKRINYFGVSEPSIRTLRSKNKRRIVVNLPGISDMNKAVTLIGETAQLSFREEGNFSPKEATTTPLILRLNKQTNLTGADVKKASVTFDNNKGSPQVSLDFTIKGGKKFAVITKRNVGKPLGIFIDSLPISAPIVQQPITGGSAVITGKFTTEEAKKLAIAINSGALPVSIKLIEQKTIGPTLGKKQVKASVFAGMVGLVAVLVFMIVYYGRLGIIATMALTIYALISLAIFRLIPVVLTLSGIAGFILSIGMAVDSNILIFERIQEEMRKGKDFEIAIRLGFGRAIDAIKDANLTTLLVAFILFNPLNWDFLPQFGTVRGFALTLAIGVATSLFTGVVITKRLIDVFYKK